MTLKIIDRKYLIGGKWFRFQVMKHWKLIGFKAAFWRYEIRLYLK